jgi:hypothetical protein
MTVVKAQVPMAEMLERQHPDLAHRGRGSHHMEYGHYDYVPTSWGTIALHKTARKKWSKKKLSKPPPFSPVASATGLSSTRRQFGSGADEDG